MTLPVPTWARTEATCSSMIERIVQLGSQPGEVVQEVLQHVPCRTGVWTTSGWHCTPQIRRSGCSSTATGASGVLAVATNPAGALGDGIEVAHPHVLLGRDAVEQRRWTTPLRRVTLARPYSPRMPATDGAAELLGDELHAVADAEDGNAEVVDRRVERRRTIHVDALRARRERMIAAGFLAPHLGGRDAVGHDLASTP